MIYWILALGFLYLSVGYFIAAVNAVMKGDLNILHTTLFWPFKE